jgi:hypothetical protein
MSDNIVFLGGRSDTGKTASLRNLKDPKGVLYLNFESKKPPFASQFTEKKVTDPYTLHTVTEKLIETGKEKYHTLVVDSITACMSLFSTKFIGKDCPNKMAAWGDYKTFYDVWAKQMLPSLEQNVIVLAHITNFEDEDTLQTYTQAVVQGSLKHIGLEADFGVVVNTAIVPLENLKDFENPLLTITEEEEIEGFKHVIQTRKTLETKDTKIRSPMGMWDKSETYIDSDVQHVLDRINNYYGK